MPPIRLESLSPGWDTQVMKNSELIRKLQALSPDAEVEIFVHTGDYPGGTDDFVVNAHVEGKIILYGNAKDEEDE
jgi:hypothetical protein